MILAKRPRSDTDSWPFRPFNADPLTINAGRCFAYTLTHFSKNFNCQNTLETSPKQTPNARLYTCNLVFSNVLTILNFFAYVAKTYCNFLNSIPSQSQRRYNVRHVSNTYFIHSRTRLRAAVTADTNLTVNLPPQQLLKTNAKLTVRKLSKK